MTHGERIFRETMSISIADNPKGGGYPILTEDHPFLKQIVRFMKDKTYWLGTETDLLHAMKDSTTPPNTVTKLLKKFHEKLYQSDGIEVVFRRTNRRRIIELHKGR